MHKERVSYCVTGSASFEFLLTQEMVNRVFTNTIYLAVLFSIVFMLPGFWCSRQLALALGANQAVLPMVLSQTSLLLPLQFIQELHKGRSRLSAAFIEREAENKFKSYCAMP